MWYVGAGKDKKCSASPKSTNDLHDALRLLKLQDEAPTSLHNAYPIPASQLEPAFPSKPTSVRHTVAQLSDHYNHDDLLPEHLKSIKARHAWENKQYASLKLTNEELQDTAARQQAHHHSDPEQADKPATMLSVMPHMWASFRTNKAADDMFASRNFAKSAIYLNKPKPDTQYVGI